MKLNVLESHDRLLSYKKSQESSIQKGLEECIKTNPLSVAFQDKSSYIYIFAHPRTKEDGVTKVMLWQPRLIRPKPQTNSYLFRLQSKTDIVEVCWMLPPRELWPQYKKGNVTESEIVNWSIDMFTNHREKLEAPLPDDLSDQHAMNIYMEIAGEMDADKSIKRLYGVKPHSLGASTDLFEKSSESHHLDASYQSEP